MSHVSGHSQKNDMHAISNQPIIPRVVAFDFDGTIVPSMEAYGRAAAKLIHNAYGIDEEKAYGEYMQTSGLPFPEQLVLIAPQGTAHSALNAAFEIEKENILLQTLPEKDMKHVLAKLKEYGIPAAVSSNNTENLLKEYVGRHALVFHYVLGYRGDHFKKGSDHFSFLCAQVSCTTDEILFVADSLKDAEIAGTCGVRFIGKLGTFTRAQFLARFPGCKVIEKISEILNKDVIPVKTGIQ